METDRINFLLNNPSEATVDDILLVQNEINENPYSQALHILQAKIQIQLDTEDKDKKLTLAAIYSGDRTILKKVILEDKFMEACEEIIPFQDLSKFEPDSLKSQQETEIKENDSSSIFDEVLKNLEKLKSLRQQFQFLELNEPEKTSYDKSKVKKAQKKIKKTYHTRSEKPETEKPEIKKSDSKQKKMNEILEKDEALDTEVNTYFLNEIEKSRSSKEKIESDKSATQNQIIEKFIEKQPTIGSIKREAEKSAEETNKDLSEKSTIFGDDLVSENLAIILLKQGKKERAIDIYKKLIWKLPQKKAYFAARIEEIKT